MRFKDLFINNCFPSFEQLSARYNLSKDNFFRYLQIRHFLASQLPSFPNANGASMIDDILSLNPTRKRFISIIYDKLVEIRQAPLDKIKKAWEHDLNTSLSNSEWESIFKLINTSSLCARHRLLQFKVVHRAHWSKVRLSSIYPNVDPHCDKCLSDEASLIHMFWTCPSLENFWKEVFRTLSVILKIDLKPNPLVAIFGATGGEVPTSHQPNVVFCFLPLCWLGVLFWSDGGMLPRPPTLNGSEMLCLALLLRKFATQ